MRKTTVRYEIRIEGHLAPLRLRHLEGVLLQHEADGVTVITGHCRDQPALRGLLGWLWSLGAKLLLVRAEEE